VRAVIRPLRTLADPRDLARLVADRYELAVTGCELVRSLVNDVYRVDTATGPRALKVYRHGHRTRAEVEWEARLASLLDGAGVAVARAVPLSDGEGHAGDWAAPEGERPYALWEWAPGRKPRPPFTDALYRDVGVLVAHFHTAADAAGVPAAPRRVDLGGSFDAACAAVGARLGSADRARLVGLAARARARIPNSLDRGICHGDVSLDNVHVDDAGRVVLYDLDLAGDSWRAADLTGVAATPHWPAFLRGYRSVRPFPDTEVAALPWLDVVQRVHNLRFHLVDKPAWRGTESVGEGWADRDLAALRAAADRWTAAGG
jgi:Ser/Thr protein kinase RdoA (MazF antagonist)